MQAFPNIWSENTMAHGEGSALGLYWALTALQHNSYGHYGTASAAAQQNERT